MASLSSVSDSDLLSRMPGLVLAERAAAAEVIEHLIELDRRQLYLDQACSSLYRYCIERLGYSEDEAVRRVRVARVAQKLPMVLEHLRSGAIHLTGLFLLSGYLTDQNAEALLVEARGRSRRELEKLLARWFPRSDTGSRIQPIMELSGFASPGAPLDSGSGGAAGWSSPTGCPATGQSPVVTCSEQGSSLGGSQTRAKIVPLSPACYRVEFTASAELYVKLERATELLSHVAPGGELATVIERALDALIERQMRRRIGAGKPRQRRPLRLGSRHVPREVVRLVWERDEGQCSFVDVEGRRCTERRYLTLEHRHPYALGGPPTVDNICLLCKSHNAQSARHVFGEEFLEKKRSERRISAKSKSKSKLTLSSAPTTSTKSDVSIAPVSSAPPPITTNCLSSPERSTPGPVERADLYAQLVPILGQLGFRKRQVSSALSEIRARHVEPELEPLLRAALAVLVP